MEKQIFKAGDRVFHYNYKWGEVIKTYSKELAYRGIGVLVAFDGAGQVAFEDKGLSSLSFTEYTLQGFSQERPINWNDYIGKWGKFWNDKYDSFVIGKLSFFNGKQFGEKYYGCHHHFVPFTDEQIKILGLE
ncbi:MAG: hypothetical protein Q4B43_05240 [Bacteroidota bacterium]|nr:hypothetical protein [Bacteroidota bacterium]